MFFLGGHDAEMDEIKNLLEQEGYTPFDKGLSWDNALLLIRLKIVVRKNLTGQYCIELKIITVF